MQADRQVRRNWVEHLQNGGLGEEAALSLKGPIPPRSGLGGRPTLDQSYPRTRIDDARQMARQDTIAVRNTLDNRIRVFRKGCLR